MARVEVKRTLRGRLVGFLFREPVMHIELRTAAGRVTKYRFVPDMAHHGAAVSPAPPDWALGAPVLLDPAHARAGEQVRGIRLISEGDWAFRQPQVGFDVIRLGAGFAAGLQPPQGGPG